MNALTTAFSPPAWCANRYAVYIATPPWDSTNVPSSGWVDPSFTKCIPSQYSTTYPSFSPGICPYPMTVVASESNVSGRRTVWTGRCCQSGFTTPDINPDFFCTSAVTAPISLLVIPNITTTDIYTTLPDVRSIQHDQVTVFWEQSDLSLFPRQAAAEYASIMGLSWAPALTFDAATTNPAPTTSTAAPTAASTGPIAQPTLPPVTADTSSTIVSSRPTASSSAAPATTTIKLNMASHQHENPKGLLRDDDSQLELAIQLFTERSIQLALAYTSQQQLGRYPSAKVPPAPKLVPGLDRALHCYTFHVTRRRKCRHTSSSFWEGSHVDWGCVEDRVNWQQRVSPCDRKLYA
ncbi:hypothetical protein Micbo1qcDRAFT_178017 [Microdochium bolleyi]|uniref:Uncharacterized protein n=1 Tax=Microdochium bolleyi TaxID=196109 RepID=A0A136IUP8_9PEZI|nr:hypothetical protein Micbo1qcDRAFT_178017 [Microdochium bolleyi]